MSYAIVSRAPAFHGSMGAYDPVAKPVFDGCTMNLTTGRTKWPAQWACNQANFLATMAANKAMMPSDATQSAINLHFADYFNDVIAGKLQGPAGFPSTQDAPKIEPKIEPKLEPKTQPPEGPQQPTSLVAPLVTSPTTSSSTLKYVLIGGGALVVVGLIVAKAKRKKG